MQPPTSEHVVFIGASARSALDSWSRAKFHAFEGTTASVTASAIDMFGDTDTRMQCKQWLRLGASDELLEQLNTMDEGPVVPLGGAEHFVDRLDQIAKVRPLAGANTSTFNLLRCPSVLDSVARQSGIHRPERTDTRPVAARGWLFKKAISTGGLGVSVADVREESSYVSQGYFERYIRGRTYGACFIASHDKVHLIGISASLRGLRRPTRFVYQGSIGADLTIGNTTSPAHRSQIQKLGNEIAHRSGILGVFGADFICDADGQLWLLEVNPRWTASMELFEDQDSLMWQHLRACSGMSVSVPQKSPLVKGKRILYASRELTFDLDQQLQKLGPQVRLTDIPSDGTLVEPGAPICSVVAEAQSSSEVAKILASAARNLDRGISAQRR